MSSRELSPEWVLSSFIPPIAAPQHEITELIAVARRLWPSVQAHAYREQPGKSSDEALDFASEVWEGVLRSVAKTIQRSKREKLANKGYGSLSLRCFPSSVQPRSKEGAQTTTDDTASSDEP